MSSIGTASLFKISLQSVCELDDFGHEYVLAWGEDSGTGRDIVITEVDIENLVRAKAALFAGCLTLLESLSLSFEDLDQRDHRRGFWPIHQLGEGENDRPFSGHPC